MNSLTAPWDRATTPPQTVSKGTVLTEEQVKNSVETLVDTGITDKFPRVDKMYADPIYNNQMFCLHSFVPTKGATPDEHGVFGFMKCRGTFHSIAEANQRAEEIIRYADSYHEIQTGYCGRPFPVCFDTKKFVAERHEIDIRKKAIETISEDIRHKRMEEKKDIDDIKQREAALLSDSKAVQDGSYVQDPMEAYTVLQVKKANLVFTYKKTQEKMLQMQRSIRDAYSEIKAMDNENPAFRQEYYERYLNARRVAGIPDSSEDNFMNYMGEDIELDFDYSQETSDL